MRLAESSTLVQRPIWSVGMTGLRCGSIPGHSVRRGSEKARAVKDLTRDDEVAAPAAASLLSRPQTASVLPAAERVRAVQPLTCDEEVATTVTSELLQRPPGGPPGDAQR